MSKDYRPPSWADTAWAQAALYLFRSWRHSFHLKGLFKEVSDPSPVGQPDINWAKDDEDETLVYLAIHEGTHSSTASPSGDMGLDAIRQTQMVGLPDGEVVSLAWMFPPSCESIKEQVAPELTPEELGGIHVPDDIPVRLVAC
jgi:hypothetical protein